ncbi:MAG: His/Gly/Thr/Pro-type tRNA ligase C-terminal domain-containing protein, partial [Haloarculaceae archaeon]
AIGRRYRRQDEVGTPYCVTVDYATIGEAEDDTEGEPGTVTVRERDTTAQRRVPVEDLGSTLEGLRDGDLSFADL